MIFEFYSSKNFEKIFNSKFLDKFSRLELLALLIRYNTLNSIQKAGSGHLGSSFSALDIFLCCAEYFRKNNGHFFSSKGHDAPAYYNTLAAYKKIQFNLIYKLRKISGLPGHPDISIKNIIFNTGSLGMGISKINGFSFNNKDKNIVIIGDGELQEGQNWEALMFLQNYKKKINPLIIVDNNKIQSDTWVKKVKDYSDIEKKIKAFKLKVKTINGHNHKKIMNEIENHFKNFNGPMVLIANTVKSKGISFAENHNYKEDLEYYPYHSGALSEKDFVRAQIEIKKKINSFLTKKNNLNLSTLKFKLQNDKKKVFKKYSLINSYSQLLYNFVHKNKNAYVLSADLVKDTGCSIVKQKIKKKFIEFGIAEQDMVSFGSGLAAQKFLPIFHSFSCFLSTRAQEQIFNFCTEKRKGIFVGALSGLLPGAPGHSHQMVRDVPIVGSIPNIVLIEILSKKMIKEFFLYQKKINQSIYVKISNLPTLNTHNEKLYLPILGKFLKLNQIQKFSSVVIFQGADLLNEYEENKNYFDQLKRVLFLSAVWLNVIDNDELNKFQNKNIIIFQSSVEMGSFGSLLSSKLISKKIKISSFSIVSINEVPKCGTNDEVLHHHKLSFKHMINKIRSVNL